MKKIDVLFAMNNLDELGIQRVVVWLLNNWDEKENGTVALSLHKKTGQLSSYLSEQVTVYELDEIIRPIHQFSFWTRVISYIILLKKIKPVKVISVNQGESLALCLTKRFYKNFRLVVCEHCHVSSNINGADAHKGWFGWYYKTFFRHEYRKIADIVHTVSFESAEDLIEAHGIPSEKVKVIYNPVEPQTLLQKAKEPVMEEWLQEGNNTFIAAARLVSQKRYDIMLKSWHLFSLTEQFQNSTPGYKLIICGNGEQEEALTLLAEHLNLKDSVKFLGFQKNPWKYVSKAKFFISTSEWEGLSCSLIESQFLGVPIIASDCPSGNKEILLNGEAGILFENKNINDCYQKIIKIAGLTADERKRVIGHAQKNLFRFSIKEITSQYANL